MDRSQEFPDADADQALDVVCRLGHDVFADASSI
jgi:hypothetical protein